MDRRKFLQTSALALAGTAAVPAEAGRVLAPRGSKDGFTMWQLNTQANLIGNSYVFLTDQGRVCVMDGGYRQDEPYLRGFLAHLGNKVDTWFVTHPHVDHMGSLTSILREPRGITIRRIYHSRFSDEYIESRPVDVKHCRNFYRALDESNGIEIFDVRQPGTEGSVDGLHFRFLSVTDETIKKNTYNNNSMITRVWDRRKSVVFLGDMGQEAAEKILASPYKADLDCDYLQMAHHGQWACKKSFYEAIRFRACLWSTPRKFWDNDDGKGPGTSIYEVPKTLQWMNELGIKEHHVSWMGLWQLD